MSTNSKAIVLRFNDADTSFSSARSIGSCFADARAISAIMFVSTSILRIRCSR